MTSRLWRKLPSAASSFLRKEWLRYLLLAAAGFIVHLPALTGTLIWDDAYLARDNPFSKSPALALESFRHYLFLDSFSAHYRPVQNLSFIADYYFWNNDICGFHLTNILLHLAAGLLLYRLLRQILRSHHTISPDVSSTVAFLVAAIWMVHPVHSAAVDYISGRADSLCFAFAAGAWLLVLQARTRQNYWLKGLLYGMAALSAFLALGSREIAAIWIVLFLADLFFFSPSSRSEKFGISVGILLIIGSYLLVRHLPEARGTPTPEPWNGWIRGTMMLRALGDYGRLLVFPSNLHMERTVVEGAHYQNHLRWQQGATNEYLAILGIGMALFLVIGSCVRGPGQRWRVFGALWFFCAYLPTSNIVQLNATVAEHWLYLPSVGFFIFLAGVLVDLPARWHRLVVTGAGFAVIALGVRGWFRSSDWSDELTFYQRTFAAGGISARVAGNLALAYSRRGNDQEAERILRRVVASTPDYPIARNNLANLLSRHGKQDEAEKLFAESERQAETARKDYPQTWIAALNLAHLMVRERREAEAISILDRARLSYPQIWELVSLESELIRRSGAPAQALTLVEDFTRLNWWHYAANLAEGKLYYESDKKELALRALHLAASLDIHETEALNLEARICVERRQLERACEAQRQAISREPNKPSQYIFLSDIYEKMGRDEQSKLALAEVARLKALAQGQTEKTVLN